MFMGEWTNMVDISQEQVEAIDEVLFDLFTRDSLFFVLTGSAGTGKTTLIHKIQSVVSSFYYKRGGNTNSVMVGTLTGKAVSVLKEKGISNASTLHALLTKPILDSKGDIIDYDIEVPNHLKFLIVDECSMTPPRFIDALLEANVKVLYVGDQKQLPPVGSESIALFEHVGFNLETIYRSDDAIINASIKAYERNEIDIQDNEEVSVDTYRNKRVTHVLKQEDPDVILCAKNETRRLINKNVRAFKQINEESISVEETVLFLKNTIDVYNGMTDVITSWKDLTDGFIEFRIKGIPSKSFYTYKRFLEEDINSSYQGYEILKDVFGSSKKIPSIVTNPQFVYITYGYGLTVHKSQGSEYDTVLFLDEPLYNVERNRLRYTAITRAKNRLIVIKDFKN